METEHLVGISAKAGSPDLSDFGDSLDAAQKLGVSTIELPIYDLDLIVGGKIRRDQLNRLKSLCAGRPVRYTVHGPLAINFFDPPFRLQRHFDVLAASLEIAAELEAIHYVMHCGIVGVTQHDGIEEAYARQREWLARAGNLAQGCNTIICLENLFAGYEGRAHTAKPSRLAQELAAISHNHVRATLDVGHAYLNVSFNGGDLVAECAKLAPFARHIHVHDCFGRQDDIWMYTDGERLAYGHGDLHLPVGWGDIPWAAIMKTCQFPSKAIFNIELQKRYWHVAQECVDATRGLVSSSK